MQKQKLASSSTNYRYKKSNLTKQLSQFCHFRNQFQNCITDLQIQQLKKVYQHGICGKNSTGNLVVVDRLGCVKINEINKILDEDALIGYFNQRLLNISQNLLGEKEQILWVVDLNGKIMQLASKKTLAILSKIIKNLQRFFPEILYKLYLVNTPMLFDTIFSKFSDEIDQDTQQKIMILGDDLDNLYEQVQPSILPDFLGGQIDENSFLKGFQYQKITQVNKKQLKENKRQQQQQDSQDDDEQQEFDFSSLKNALSGMKMGGGHLQSVSQTPLNTQADEK